MYSYMFELDSKTNISKKSNSNRMNIECFFPSEICRCYIYSYHKLDSEENKPPVRMYSF